MYFFSLVPTIFSITNINWKKNISLIQKKIKSSFYSREINPHRIDTKVRNPETQYESWRKNINQRCNLSRIRGRDICRERQTMGLANLFVSKLHRALVSNCLWPNTAVTCAPPRILIMFDGKR